MNQPVVLLLFAAYLAVPKNWSIPPGEAASDVSPRPKSGRP